MKRLLFLFSLLLMTAVVTWGQGNTITVGPSGADYTTIQAAINAASPGDIIQVAAGTYNEQIVVNKSLDIRGVQYGVDARNRSLTESIISGVSGLLSTPLISIQANNVTLNGFKIIGGGWYLLEPKANLIGIFNNIIEGTLFTESNTISDITVSYNWFRNSVHNAIYMQQSASNIGISSNLFTTIGYSALILGGSTAAYSSLTFQNNEISGTSNQAINIAGQSQTSLVISNNTISNAGLGTTERPAIRLHSGLSYNGLTIQNNVLSNSKTGITVTTGAINWTNAVISGNSFNMNDVQFRDESTTGVDLASIISNNTFDRAVVVRDNPIIVPTIFSKIQDAINAATTGQIVEVAAGVYNEDVNVNKNGLTLLGAGIANTILRGTYAGTNSGSAACLFLNANDITVKYMTVTRDYGVDLAAWYACTKNQGITFGQGKTGNKIENLKVVDQRNAVYLNNAQNYTINNCDISNNRTGIQMGNNISGGTIKNNFITNNFTHGLMINFDLGVVNADNLNFTENSITGNWYSQVYYHGTNTGSFNNANLECNWYGTAKPNMNPTAAGEPGYTSQIPPQFSGTAPGTPAIEIRGTKAGLVDYIPWLTDGYNNGTYPSFGPYNNVCTGIYPVELFASDGTTLKSSYYAIQEAINAATAGDVIQVAAGTYAEALNLNKAVTLKGANFGVSGCAIRGPESKLVGEFQIQSNNITIDGFEITGTNARIRSVGAIATWSDIAVLNNYIHATTAQQPILHGFGSGGGIGTQNWTISNNKIEDIQTADATAIALFNIDNVTVQNNCINHSNSGYYGRRGLNFDGLQTVSFTGNTVDLGLVNPASDNSDGAFTKARYPLQLSSSDRSTTGITIDGNTLGGAYDGIITLGNGAYSGISISGNTISNNVIGIRFQAGTNVPVGSLNNITIQNNTISTSNRCIYLQDGTGSGGTADPYTNVVMNNNSLFRSTAGLILEVQASAIVNNGPLSATCNWYGTTDAATIATKVSGSVNYTPYLTSGVDHDANTPGFQPEPYKCIGGAAVANANTGVIYPTIQDAIDAAANGHVINIGTGGTYAGVVFNEPGKSITITNTSGATVTIQGASPALTVTSGTLAVNGISYITPTDDPAILVNGGSLTMTNCTVTASATYAQPGIQVTSGTLNAGTTGTPGHNTFVTPGSGKAILNQTTTTISAVGNYWGIEASAGIAAKINGEVNFRPWCNVNFTSCNQGIYNPVTTIVPAAVAISCDEFAFDVKVSDFKDIGAISLVLNYDPAVLQFQSVNLDPAISGASVSHNNTTGKFVLSDYPSPSIGLNNGEVLFTLQFKLLPAISGTTTGLTWSTASSTDCEYGASVGGYVYNSTFTPYTWTIPVRPVKNTTTLLEYCKIQDAIDATQTVDGHTITVAAGTYAENVVVYKRLAIEGAGPGLTFVQGSTNGMDVIRITKGGIDAANRTIIKDLKLSTTGTGNNNNGIRIDASGGNALGYITLDNVYGLNLPGNSAGVLLHGTNVATDIITDVKLIDVNFAFNNFGVYSKNAQVHGFTVDGNAGRSKFEDNRHSGILFEGNGSLATQFQNFSIKTSDLSRNNSISDNDAGRAEMFLLGFNGDLVVENVIVTTGLPTVQAVPWYAAIAVNGKYTGGAAPAGVMNFKNVTFQNAPGALHFPRTSLGIWTFSNLDAGVTVDNCQFNSQGNGMHANNRGGLYLFSVAGNTPLILKNSTFSGNYWYNGMANDICLISSSVNVTATDNNTFTGAVNNFAIEDRIAHKIDNSALGLVTWIADNVFVTVNSFIAPATTTPSIQRGIDAAGATGWTLYTGPGTFTPEALTVNKSLTMRGMNFGANANDPADITLLNPARGAESILPNTTLWIQSADVTIDGFKLTGASGAHTNGVPANAADGLSMINNVFEDITLSAYNNSSGAAAQDDITFSNNRVDGNYSSGISAMNPWDGITNLTIIGNYFTQFERGVQFDNVSLVNLTDNYFTGITHQGVQVASGCANVNILRNVFNDCNLVSQPDRGAIRLYAGVTGTITIENNFFTNNYNAIRLRSADPFAHSYFQVHSNSFTANTMAISDGSIGSSGYINATCNWYGTSTVGGVTALNNGNVTYDPWLIDGTDGDLVTAGFQPAGTCTGATNLYVNDLVADNPTNDIYTTAMGDDSNAGTAAAPFLTITKAVNTAVDGTKIWVDAGTFQEQVFINKTLDVTGVDYNKTIILAPTTMPLTGYWYSSPPSNPIVYAYGPDKTVNVSKLCINGDGGRNLDHFVGMEYYEASGTFDLCKITGIRDVGSFTGMQRGHAFYGFYTSTTGTHTLNITNNLILDYQKGGIYVDGSGANTDVLIHNNTVTGQGVANVTAQNGIAPAWCDVVISNNTVTNHIWNKVEHPHQWMASGILLYETETSNVFGNTMIGNEVGLWGYNTVAPTYGINTFTNNKVHVYEDVTAHNPLFVYDKRVDNPAQPEAVFGCIQYAVDEASSGAVLNASAGTFVENVNVHTSVTINGAASLASIIDGGGAGAVVTIGANNTTLNGFKVTNSGTSATDAGVKLTDGGLTGVTGCVVTNNEITGNINGLGIIGGSANSVTQNNIHNNTNYGVLLIATSGNTVQSNTITYTGLDAIAMDNANVVGGPVSVGSTGNFIKTNTISNIGRDGIFIGQNCSNNQITNANNFSSINSIGIHVWRDGAQTITDNVINTSQVGMKLRGFENGTVTGNAITNNGIGVELEAYYLGGNWYPCQNNTIENNTIAGNTLGMKADHAQQNVVVDAELNWWGHATGPNHPTLNPCGQGNPVTNNVDFSPWYYTSGMSLTSLNGLSPVAVADIPNMSTITATPLIFSTSATYQNDISGYDPAILTDARLTSNLPFPAGSQVISVKYNGNEVLPAAYNLTGMVAYLSDIINYGPTPLNGHSGVVDNWELTVAGFSSAQVYNISLDAVTYIGSEATCNTVRGTDPFTVTFADATIALTPVTTTVCTTDPLKFNVSITYPTISNVHASILNDNAILETTPTPFPSGTTIAWSYNSGAASGTYTYAGGTSIKLSDIVNATYPGLAPTPLQGHTGTDSWDITITNAGNPALYNLKIQPIAKLGTTDYPYTPGATTVLTVNNCGISGVLTYYNNANTLLKSVPVALYKDNAPYGSPAMVDITDGTTAAFEFPSLPAGIYELRPVKTDQVGSINTTDAAQVNYYPGAPYAIERVRFLAGDVDEDSYTTLSGNDASRIQQYFVYGTPFTRAPWVFWNNPDAITSATWSGGAFPKVVISNAPVTANLYGMVTGDFNRSWTPAKAAPALDLVSSGSIVVGPEQTFDLPVRVANAASVGAVSLVLEVPAKYFEVQDVVMNGQYGQFAWSVTGSELRISWYNNAPMHLISNETLLTLKMKTTAGFVAGTVTGVTLSADPGSELADGHYQLIPNAVLTIEQIDAAVGIENGASGQQLSLGSRPNPFNKQTHITYGLPFAGTVTLDVYNMMGMKVATLANEHQMAGFHSSMLSNPTLTPGVYTVVLTLRGEGEALVRTLKVVKH